MKSKGEYGSPVSQRSAGASLNTIMLNNLLSFVSLVDEYLLISESRLVVTGCRWNLTCLTI